MGMNEGEEAEEMRMMMGMEVRGEGRMRRGGGRGTLQGQEEEETDLEPETMVPLCLDEIDLNTLDTLMMSEATEGSGGRAPEAEWSPCAG